MVDRILSEKDGPEYTLAETIDALQGWERRGRIADPVAVAYSAIHWIEQAPESLRDQKSGAVLALLKEWIVDSDPHIPDATVFLARRLLQRLQPPPSGGG